MTEVYDPEIPTEDSEGVLWRAIDSGVTMSKPTSAGKANVSRVFGAKKLFKGDDKPIKFQILGKKLPLVQYSDDESDNAQSGSTTPVVKSQMSKLKSDNPSELTSLDDAQKTDGALVKLATYESDSGSEKSGLCNSVRGKLLQGNKESSIGLDKKYLPVPLRSETKKSDASLKTKADNSENNKQRSHKSVSSLDSKPSNASACQAKVQHSSDLRESSATEQKKYGSADPQRRSKNKLSRKASPLQSPIKDLSGKRHGSPSKGPSTGLSPKTSRHSRSSPLPKPERDLSFQQEVDQKRRAVSPPSDQDDKRHSQKLPSSQKDRRRSSVAFSTRQQGLDSPGHERQLTPQQYRRHSQRDSLLSSVKRRGSSYSDQRRREAALEQPSSIYTNIRSPSCDDSYEMRSSKSVREFRGDSPNHETRRSLSSRECCRSQQSSNFYRSDRIYVDSHSGDREIHDRCSSPEWHEFPEPYHCRKNTSDAFGSQAGGYASSKDDRSFRVSPERRYKRGRDYEQHFEDFDEQEFYQQQPEDDMRRRRSKDRHWSSTYDDSDMLPDDGHFYRREIDFQPSKIYPKDSSLWSSAEEHDSKGIGRKRSRHFDRESTEYEYRPTLSKDTAWEPKKDKVSSSVRRSIDQQRSPNATEDVRNSAHLSDRPTTCNMIHKADGSSGQSTKAMISSGSVREERENRHRRVGSKSFERDSTSKEAHLLACKQDFLKQDAKFSKHSSCSEKTKEANKNLEGKAVKDGKRIAVHSQKSPASSESSAGGDSSSSSDSDSSSSSSSSSSESATSCSGNSAKAKRNSGKKPLQKSCEKVNDDGAKPKATKGETVKKVISPNEEANVLRNSGVVSCQPDPNSGQHAAQSSSSDSSSSSSSGSGSDDESSSSSQSSHSDDGSSSSSNPERDKLSKGARTDTVQIKRSDGKALNAKNDSKAIEIVSNHITSPAMKVVDDIKHLKVAQTVGHGLEERQELALSKRHKEQSRTETIVAKSQKVAPNITERGPEAVNRKGTSESGNNAERETGTMKTAKGRSCPGDGGSKNLSDKRLVTSVGDDDLTSNNPPDRELQTSASSDTQTEEKQGVRQSKDLLLVPTVLLKTRTAKLKSTDVMETVKYSSSKTEKSGNPKSNDRFNDINVANFQQILEDVVTGATLSANFPDDTLPEQMRDGVKHLPRVGAQPVVNSDCAGVKVSASEAAAHSPTRYSLQASKEFGRFESQIEERNLKEGNFDNDDTGQKARGDEKLAEIPGISRSNDSWDGSRHTRRFSDEKKDKLLVQGSRRRSPSKDRRSRSHNRSGSCSSRRSGTRGARSRKLSHRRSSSVEKHHSRTTDVKDNRGNHDQYDRHYKDQKKELESYNWGHRSRSRSREYDRHGYRRSPDYQYERQKDRENSDHCRGFNRNRGYYDRDRRQRHNSPDRRSGRNYEGLRSSHSVEKHSYDGIRDNDGRKREPDVQSKQHHLPTDLDNIPLPSGSTRRSSDKIRSGKEQTHIESAVLLPEPCHHLTVVSSVSDHDIIHCNVQGSLGNYSDRESIDMELENSDDQDTSKVESSVLFPTEQNQCERSKTTSSKMIGGKVAFMMKDSGRKSLVAKKKSVFEDDSDTNECDKKPLKHRLDFDTESKGDHSTRTTCVSSSSHSQKEPSALTGLSHPTADLHSRNREHSIAKVGLMEKEPSKTEVTSSRTEECRDRNERHQKHVIDERDRNQRLQEHDHDERDRSKRHRKYEHSEWDRRKSEQGKYDRGDRHRKYKDDVHDQSQSNRKYDYDDCDRKEGHWRHERDGFSRSDCRKCEHGERRRSEERDCSDRGRRREWDAKPKGGREHHSSRFEPHWPRRSVSREPVIESSSTVSEPSADVSSKPCLVSYPLLRTQPEYSAPPEPTRGSHYSEFQGPAPHEKSPVSNIMVVTDATRNRTSRFGTNSFTSDSTQTLRFMDHPTEVNREGIGVMISGSRAPRERVKVERVYMVKPLTLTEEIEVSSSTSDTTRQPEKGNSLPRLYGNIGKGLDDKDQNVRFCFRDESDSRNMFADSTKRDIDSGSPVLKNFDVASGSVAPEGDRRHHSARICGRISPARRCGSSDSVVDPGVEPREGAMQSATAHFLSESEAANHRLRLDAKADALHITVSEKFIEEIPSPHCCIWEALEEWSETSVAHKEHEGHKEIKPAIYNNQQLCFQNAGTSDSSQTNERRNQRRRHGDQNSENLDAEQRGAEEEQSTTTRRRSTRLRSKEEKKGANEVPAKSGKSRRRTSENRARKGEGRSLDGSDDLNRSRIHSDFDTNSSLDSSFSSQLNAEEGTDVHDFQRALASSGLANINALLGKGHFAIPIKPEKVKSRWRRCSELDSTGLAPPPPPPPRSDDDRGEFKSISSFVCMTENLSLSGKTHLEGGSAESISGADKLQTMWMEEMEQEQEEQPYFEEIQDNIFLSERDMKKSRKEARRMVCDCTLPSAEDTALGVKPCGEDCLNRMLMIECGSRCQCGTLCTNKLFQQHQYARTRSFKSGAKGWGLQAAEDMTPGTFIMEYVGEVLDYKQFKTRTKKYARENAMHHYFMALNADEVIDATQKGNVSRFINHSCDPNAETQKWTVNGQLRIGFFIVKPVASGEEITFNYQFESYGREKIKCFCGSANCRGVIGSEKSTPFRQKRSKETKQKDKKKRKELFNDSFLEEEIEDMLFRGGLHRKDHVLELNRLMLRAESMDHRLSLLKVLRETKEPACLRLFLEYHGLPLLWSWMVDIPTTAEEFKMQVLNTLKILPINNKTMLKESRVLSVVEKWAQETGDDDVVKAQKPVTECAVTEDTVTEMMSESSDETKPMDASVVIPAKQADPPSDERKVDSHAFERTFPHKKRLMLQLQQVEASSSDGEPAESAKTEDTESQLEEESSEADGQNNAASAERQQSEEASQTFDSASDASHDDDPADLLTDSSKPKIIGLFDLASELLLGWKSLKEVYKIPKIMVEERKKTEQELDRQYEEKSVSRRDSYQGWDTASADRRRRNDESPEIRYGNKRRRQGDELEENRTAKSRKVLLPTPQTLSKQERRQQFEAQVKAQEEMQKICGSGGPEQHQPDSTYLDFYATADPSSVAFAAAAAAADIIGSVSSYPQDTLIAFQDVTPSVLSDSSTLGYGETVAGMPYNESLSICYDSYYPDPSVVAASMYSDPTSSLQYVEANVGGSANQNYVDPNQASLFYGPHGLQYGQPMYYSTTQGGSVLLPSGPVSQTMYHSPASASSPFVQIPSDQSLQIRQLKQQLEIARRQGPTDPRDPPPPPPSPPRPKTVRLPPNWKTAKDTNGKVYYYHTVTRQTQWDPPAFDSGMNEEGDDDDDDDDMDLGTPTNDDTKKQKRRTTTAAADTSSEEIAKKIKDQFRAKIAKHIVTYLSPYRRVDCEQGRICGAEDFKHLARKLTHTILSKELKHCRHLEDLEVNENVKGKAKDFVSKYMSKFGPMYKPSAGSP